MKLARRAAFLLLTLLAIASAHAQSPVELKLQLRGIDQNQNVAFVLHRLDQERVDTKLFTNAQGAASVRIPAGRYQLSTDPPLRVGGQVYRWDLEIPATDPVNSVDLTPANATVETDDQAPAPGTNTPSEPRSEEDTQPSVSWRTITSSTRTTPITNAANEEVMALLNRWITAVRQHDLETLMSCYAPHMTVYFRKRDVSADEVRRDKAKFLRTYTDIRQLAIRDVRLEQNSNGTEVTLHKLWDFAGDGTFSGEVVSRLTLANNQGRLVISGERERLIWRKKFPTPTSGKPVILSEGAPFAP